MFKLLEAYTATHTPIVTIKISMTLIGVRKLAARAQAYYAIYYEKLLEALPHERQSLALKSV